MPDRNPFDDSFDETLRSIAGEVGRFIERSVENLDVDRLAESTGVDPGAAREWVDSAATWVRTNTENLGDELSRRFAHGAHGPHGGAGAAPHDPFTDAIPHPLDVPTADQGLALAALDSGRWTIEPGTETLNVRDEGPGPSGAPGVIRELRVRDWITREGEVTLTGRYALTRWLESTAS